MDKSQPHPLFKLATELGPLIVFFVVNAKFNLAFLYLQGLGVTADVPQSRSWLR